MRVCYNTGVRRTSAQDIFCPFKLSTSTYTSDHQMPAWAALGVLAEAGQIVYALLAYP